jgi:TIR domain
MRTQFGTVIGGFMPRRAQTQHGIFISHTAAEADVAEWLKTAVNRDFLGALSIYVSSDRETIAAGQRWLDGLGEALKTADLQVLVLSRQSVKRPWVNFEAGAGWIQGIPIVPVCHSGLDKSELPVPLNMLQSIVLTAPEGLAKLYDAIAGILGLNTPAVDFGNLAAQARDLEARHEQATSPIKIIENPRVLCAASAAYAQPRYGFDLDVAVVEKHFPNRVTVDRALSSSTLLDRLASERYDIVHLVLRVDPTTGSLLFDACGPQEDVAPGNDVMTSEGFASLLTESATRLVVLATCKALLLAVDVARVANMAASDEDIHAAQAVDWADHFYGLLAKGKSVHKAFDLMRSQDKLAIRAVYQEDVKFASRQG